MSVKPAHHKANTSNKHQFLAALEVGKTVVEAAKLIGVNRKTVYDWRDQDKSFLAAWDDAKQTFAESTTGQLQNEVLARALDRTDRYSHLLLMFAMKRFDPAYKEAFKIEHKSNGPAIEEFTFSDKEVDEAIAILQDAKKQSQNVG